VTDLAGYLAHAKSPRRGQRQVAHEAADQEALTSAASLKWWWPGYQHHEPARASLIEKLVLKAQGVKPGWPDVTLHIPRAPKQKLRGGGYGTPSPPIAAALELKAERHRPKRPVEREWWLAWKVSDEDVERERTHYQLRAAQAWQLQLLAGVGYRTMVAYGWEEALAWLDETAGRRPNVLPEGW
jgi:hypothetical protein